jgi:hypothetical protein
LVVARHGRPVRRNFASIKKGWTRRYSAWLGPFGSRKVELLEAQVAIKRTNALYPARSLQSKRHREEAEGRRGDPEPPASTLVFWIASLGSQWRARSRPHGALGGVRMRSSLCLATILAATGVASAETPQTISQLLSQGWEIAGYASGYDNRTSLMLFRHPGVNALVQCGILYDVTRNPRTIVNCYELK